MGRPDGFTGQRLCVVPRPLVAAALTRAPTRRLLVTDAGVFTRARDHMRRRPSGTSRTNSGQPSAGLGYEMDAITAVVLGGVLITGGKGNIWLVIVGVLIMGTLSTGMVMNNINDYVQQVIKGLVLIGGVAFAQFSQKVKSRNVVV